MISEVRILGPIEVELGDGGSARVPRGRALSLLALLVVNRGAIVSLDRIVDELWQGEGPQNARNAVQVVASRLRAAVGDDALLSEARGYGVSVPLDADRFEDAHRRGGEELARGEPEEAAATLADALALWRGPALVDVADEGFAQPEIARLEDLRLACLADRIDADLACGRHDEVAGELEALVRAYPLRERLRGQQMLALYRCGRQAEALEAYRAAYQALVDGLGIEPSPELRTLEAAILRHDVPAPAGRARRVALAPDVRRRVTCLFSRLAVPGEDPESLRARAERHQEAARAACARHGGGVAELRGDALLMAFGTPVAHEDDALRALRAAAELRGDPEPLALGVGTGDVVAPLIGEAPAAAERLARAAAPGEVRVDAATWRLVRHGAHGRELSDGAYVLTDVDADAPAIRRRLDRPLLGRAHELEQLRLAFERVLAARAPALLTIVGEPGIGKTRLVAELAAIAGDRGRVLSGRCPAYGEGITYWPLREVVAQAQGDRSSAQLAADLGLAPSVVDQVAAAVGLGSGRPGEEIGSAFLRVLSALSRRRPLIVVVDDAHLAEPALLELLGDAAGRLRDAPALLVAVARPDLEPRVGEVLELGPLSPDASSALLDAIDDGRLDARERRRIAAAAGGNPLFLEQLVAYVDERPAALDALPPALHALLAARLDRLDAAERSALALGAVVGDAFAPAAVHALAGITRGELDRAFEQLVERDLLVHGAGELRFRHGLVREAAYASLAKSARARLHERHADWLDVLGAEVPEADARIGLHLETAWHYELEIGGEGPPALASRAGRRLAAAARIARGRGDLPGEIGFLDRAVALLGTDSEQGAELLPELVSALVEAGLSARAEVLAERAVATAAALGLPRVGAWSAIERERIRLSRHPETFDVAAAVAVVEQATRTLAELRDDLGLARAWYLMADLAWLLGDPEASYLHAQRMLDHARTGGSGFDVATALTFMAWCLVEGPCPVPEAVALHDALERAAAGQRAAELTVVGCRAVLMAMLGRYDEARSQMAESSAGLAELQLRGIALYVSLLESVAEMLAGDPAAAEDAVRGAEASALESGDRWYQALVHVDLTHAVLAQEDRLDATDVVARIETLAAPCDIEWTIKRHTARALIALRAGEAEAGLADAQAGVAAAETTTLALCRANAQRTLAELLWATGRDEEAAVAVTRALALDEAKGNRASAQSTRERFAALLG
jgi:DNA-binding SARP family transcriptional activator